MYPEPPAPGWLTRTYRRSELLAPGSVARRAHDSESGPYAAELRQAVQVVDLVQASWFDVR
jgi:hypothetical protein